MSKKTTQTIIVDLLKPQIITLHAKQYDVLSRECKFRLLAGGEAFTIDSGVTVAVQYSKPDGTHGFYDTMPDGGAAATVTTENGGTVLTLLFAPQVLTAAGDVRCSVSMYYTDALEKLQSFSVTIKVESAETDGTGSADYYNMHTLDELNTAIENAVKFTSQMLTEVQKARARLNIGAMDSSAIAYRNVTAEFVESGQTSLSAYLLALGDGAWFATDGDNSCDVRTVTASGVKYQDLRWYEDDSIFEKRFYIGGTLAYSMVCDGNGESVISKLAAPTQDSHAANKKYVDDSIAAAIGTAIGGSY